MPGSTRVINALYDYYCAGIDGEDIATTTHCPSLPTHLNCGVHDVASTFKRFLAGLPGGILGSLALFDALVAVHSQLHGTTETNRTKASKLRARMIALAISTVRSQYQRELICAVFGLLCLVGRTAENAPREDEYGRPLPTSDLMGYSALAIIFGPLLVGDLLSSYSMKLADPVAGLIVLPMAPCKTGKHRRLKTTKQKPAMLAVDRIMVANDIAEMLLVHWRDVVRNLASLKAQKRQEETRSPMETNDEPQRHDQKDDLTSSKADASATEGNMHRTMSQGPRSQAPRRMSTPPVAHSASYSGKFLRHAVSLSKMADRYSGLGILEPHGDERSQEDALQVKRRRSRPQNTMSFRQLSYSHSASPLSPTMEEAPGTEQSEERPEIRRDSVIDSVSSKKSAENQANTASPRTDQTLNASQRSSGQLSPSDSTMPSDSRPTTHRVTTHDLEHAQINVDTKRVAGTMFTESSMSLGTVRRHSLSTVVSDTSRSEDRYTSFIEGSTAGRTPPLDHGPRHPKKESKSTRVVAFSEDNTHNAVSSSQSGATAKENMDSNSKPGQGSSLSHKTIVVEAVSSESSSKPPSAMTKSPTYTPSALDPLRSPPLYKGEFAPSVEQDSRGQHDDEHRSIPVGQTSPASRWRQLVKDSPTSSPAEMKTKRMARASKQSLSREALESGPREINTNSPALDWKRQLLMRRKRREESDQDRLSPSKPTNGIYKTPLKYGHTESSQSTNGEASSSVKPPTSAPSSHRTASKPANGVVRAIAARFDSISQESSPSQPHTSVRGSRSFASQDAENETQAKTPKVTMEPAHPKTPATTNLNVANSSLQRVKSTPGRFRASINRISQGLRSSPALARYAESPSPSKPADVFVSETPIFEDARDHPPVTPVRLPRLQLQPVRPLSPDAIVAPQGPHERSSRANGSNMGFRPHAPPGRGNATDNGGDEVFQATRQIRRSDSGTGSILHHQIRRLHSQLNVRNEHIQNLRRDLDAMYGADVGILSERLRRAKGECRMWRERAENAEKRVAAFERFKTKFKNLKEDVDNMANGGGSVASKYSHENSRQGLSQSCPGCSVHPEKQASNFKCHCSPRDTQNGGSDGVDSPEVYENYISKYLDDTQGGTKYCSLSKAQSELWIAAEKLLGV